MRTRLTARIDAILEPWFPERRLFLRSDSETRFIRLRPSTQIIACAGSAAVVAWAIVATAVLLMDSIGSGNFRDQARRDQQTYEHRLNQLASERDTRSEEALASQARFNLALDQISEMQTELLASETARRELETGIEVIQSNLRKTMKQRDSARQELAALEQEATETTHADTLADAGENVSETVDFLVSALSDTAAERDKILADAQQALTEADDLAFQIKLMRDQNDVIFRQLEDAMTVSVKPLDKMFRSAGLNTDSLINQVRRSYSGQGGPLTPLSFSTSGEEPSLDTSRANRILNQLDALNLYRIAATKAPFAKPVHAAVRYTSGFGYRRDPKTGGRRLHKGSDFAGPVGTAVFSTADGVVTHAGWLSGYGRLIKIQHEFGIETRYAHLSKIRVKVGQRVSRGDRIGDMGNSGRSTGTHLHYEVRVGGKAVNPMIYIKAANDVF
ncbi:M23 family metallopeptidase [Thalassovita sp.]|uniref:M23 family metallopeptidase n=1 Tax=Thalassovita sp. TaxID=1979401 RepID=UPI002B26C1A1|nr:M23 family metallopeptidase [Thalassovita sp.]